MSGIGLLTIIVAIDVTWNTILYFTMRERMDSLEQIFWEQFGENSDEN